MHLNNNLSIKKAEILYKKENVSIKYFHSDNLLIQTWSNFVSSEDFRKAIDYTVEFATKKPVKYILSDALKQAVIHPDDSKYAAMVMPKLVNLGLIAFAFVIPEDIFTKIALKKFSDLENTDQVQYFLNFEDAMSWISEKGKL